MDQTQPQSVLGGAPAAAPAGAPAPKKSNVGVIVAIIVAALVLAGGAVAAVLIITNNNNGSKDETSNSKNADDGKDDKKSNGGNEKKSSARYDSMGKCKFYECLEKLTGDSTEEEVEAVIGFEPKTETNTTSKTEKHTWTFDDKHTIVMNVSTYSSKKSTISIKLDKYEDDDIEQKGVVFDKVQEIKSNLNKGDGVDYDEFKEYMGGVDGVLIEVGTNKKYEWRSTDSKGYMTGTFNDDGRCTFMNGMTY